MNNKNSTIVTVDKSKLKTKMDKIEDGCDRTIEVNSSTLVPRN